jgi:hypothetical protein
MIRQVRDSFGQPGGQAKREISAIRIFGDLEQVLGIPYIGVLARILSQKMLKIITIILTFITVQCFATGQQSELIIFEGDTLQMLCEPLEPYLREHEPRKQLHIRLDVGCSTALWRGYVGLWEYKNNKLYLVDIYACGEKSMSIKGAIFKNSVEPIIASWYTGSLFIQKGKMIKYHHSGYDRIYEREIVADVDKGEIHSIKTYDNGVRPDDHGFSRNPNDILEKIYHEISWENIRVLSKDHKLFVTFQVGEGGKLINLKIESSLDKVYEAEIMNVLSSFPPVQVLYSRGQPALEGWTMKIVFSKQSKRKYNIKPCRCKAPAQKSPMTTKSSGFAFTRC